jgi:hypothetical protein
MAPFMERVHSTLKVVNIKVIGRKESLSMEALYLKTGFSI